MAILSCDIWKGCPFQPLLCTSEGQNNEKYNLPQKAFKNIILSTYTSLAAPAGPRKKKYLNISVIVLEIFKQIFH